MQIKTIVALLIIVFTSIAHAREFPPAPGQRYDVGGYNMHIFCKGEGSPTVIIDAGLGDDSSDWFEIQDESAKITRTCVYDRPGYGWSDIGPRPRSSLVISHELEVLLKKAHIEGPYVLVGHSFGGYNMRIFAANHPDKISGLLLVDASHENQYEKLNIKLPQNLAKQRNTIILPKQSDQLLTDKAVILQERAYNAARAEINAFYQSSNEVKKYHQLPNIPLIIVTRGQGEWKGRVDGEKREKIWVSLQQDLWKLSPRSQHIFAFHSGHDIQLQQPEIINSAIADLVATSRVMQ
ncbi:hypothetical protein LCGC14_0574900 [marine sediment metagenome]|uniref:AB hydrolase-1 domain-containing protein n=2 Tax=root TaxID=1 RepID=A0A0F9URG5_9ZZZZ|nr:alpha/beta hydrolase [Methylophaga aminisulfidivorans]